MKIGLRKKKNNTIDDALGLGKPSRNQSKKDNRVVIVVAITALLIFWVYSMGRKAEQTVQVVMMAQNVHKGQLITEAMIKPYDMLLGEFEKFAIVNNQGVNERRIVLWEERGEIINSFAAFTLRQDTYAEYRTFIKSRIDNSDSVLYSFPGKELVPLAISSTELQAFKTFLRPGDRLNIDALFSQRTNIAQDDGFGGVTRSQVEVFRSEPVFRDIMIADLLNQRGESILDIYEAYRHMSVYEQAQLDRSQAFRDSTEPRTLLVALTPEEKIRYYYYMSKNQVQFRASMPQRVE